MRQADTELDKERKAIEKIEEQEFGTRIKEIRKSLKMSQEEFAIRLGVIQRTLSFLEHGDRELSLRMAKKISREFNVNFLWLSFGSGEIFGAKA